MPKVLIARESSLEGNHARASGAVDLLPCNTGDAPAPGRPRDYGQNRFVYRVISQRAHGLSIGVNLNPDRSCNFSCVYCEVNRGQNDGEKRVDLALLATELTRALELVKQNQIRELPGYRNVPQELLHLKEVALSGDGEPTLCPNFAEVVETVFHIRAQGHFPFFKVVLITNGSGLHFPEVQAGLPLFTPTDEIWVKLDVGTQAFLERVNRATVPLDQILSNILLVARKRPVVVQSLFPLINGQPPPREEIQQYVRRLLELKRAGAQISLVQVYSAHRPVAHSGCAHLPLKDLSRIARRVRRISGLKAEVF